MNLRITMLFVLPIACFGASAADNPQGVDELSVERVFERLSDAWEAGDGEAWGDEFVDDADFTVWFGLGMTGRQDIAQGHQFIFERFYNQTQVVIDVVQIRMINGDAAVVHLGMSVIKEGDMAPEVPDTVPIAVLERKGSDWKIVAFQNTPKLEGRYGDIREFKKGLAANHQPQ